MTDEQFTPLAERYMDTVFRVAYSYLRCRDDADDVTQDVLIQLYKEDKAFESDAHVKNWLIRVTVNRCKNVLRAPWHKAEDIADYENTLVFEQPQYRKAAVALKGDKVMLDEVLADTGGCQDAGKRAFALQSVRGTDARQHGSGHVTEQKDDDKENAPVV